MPDSPLTKSLAELSRFFVGDGSVQQTLGRVADLTLEAIPAADLVGITMIVEGRPSTAVYTDEVAPKVDQAQYDAGVGPCLEALAERRVTRVEATLESGPWPEFRRAAAAQGIRSTVSFPLVADKSALGALNVYSRRERAFGDDDVDTGTLFASQAAIVLANAQAYWDARELSVGLSDAMRNRAAIEQAKGMIMAAEGCDEDAAFEILVRASQRENVKLRDVAQRIVDNAIKRGKEAESDDARISER